MYRIYMSVVALLAGAVSVHAQYADAQAQAQQAYQTSRNNYILALSQAGYNASDYVLPENLNQTNSQMMNTRQMEASLNTRSTAAAAAVGAITKEHRALDYNNDKIATLRDRIRELQDRFKPEAKNRLPEEVFRRQVHEIQIRILNIVLSEKDSEIGSKQLEVLRADPKAIIIDDPLLYPVEGQP